MKRGRMSIKRTLSMILALVMILSMFPAVALAAETRTIYLKAGVWDTASAWFDAWVWGSAQADAWYTFTDADGDGIYETQVPADATGMKVLRKDPADTAHGWSSWNDSGDLTIGTENCFVVSDWGSYTWETYTPVSPTYTIAGSISPAGWSPENGERLTAENGYSYTYTNVAAGSYEFKVTDGTWTNAWPQQNYAFDVAENGSSVTITFDVSTKTITVDVAAPEPQVYSVTFNGTNVTSDGGTEATAGQAYTAKLTPATGYALPTTVDVTVGNGASTRYSLNGSVLTIPADKVTGDIVITAVAGRIPSATTYTVVLQSKGVGFSGASQQATAGQPYTCKVVAQTGYTLPETISVSVNGVKISNYTYDSTTGELMIPAEEVTGRIIIQATGVEKPTEPETITVYFRNDWLWTDVRAHYWGGAAGSEWPGVAMEKVGTDSNFDVYAVEIPADTTGLLFNGIKNNGSGDLDQTPDITTGIADGAAWYIYWNNANAVGTFTYPPTGGDSAVPGTTYIIAGTAGLCGSAWDITDSGNAMTLNDEGLYTKTFASVKPGTHKFKVTAGSWSSSWGDGHDDDGNTVVTLNAISNVTVTFNAETKVIGVTHTPTGEVFEPVDYVTIHFRNTGMWSKVNAYSWYNGTETTLLGGWPGKAVTENGDHANWYTVELTDLADNTGVGFIFSNNGSSQTEDILIEKSGEYWYDGKLMTEEPANFADGSVKTVKYEVTLHFADSKNWGSASLYTWTVTGANPTGAWPGTAAGLDSDGYYSISFDYEAPEGQGLSFIFSGGGQTVDLKLDASDFVNNKAEKWVSPTTADAEGKFYADIADDPAAIAVSPVVSGQNITFAYKNTEAAKVEVFGSMGMEEGDTKWIGHEMIPNDYGVWSVTLENVAYGLYEYKFVIDGTTWVVDPVNGWVVLDENGNPNSAVLVSDPSNDDNEVTINVHYDAPSAEWNVCAWGATGLEPQYNFSDDVATITLDGRANQYVAFKIRKSIEGNDWAEQSGEIRVNLGNIVSGTIDIRVNSDFSWSQSLNADVVYANKIKSMELDYDNNTVVIQTTMSVSDAATAFDIFKDGASAGIVKNVTAKGSTYTLELSETMDLVTLYQYTIRFTEDTKFAHKPHTIGTNTVYASTRFGSEFTYNGTDLGANWTKDATTFVVWAPTAENVDVKLYKSGTEGVASEGDTSVAMTRGENGIWTATVEGDLNGTYYTYAVTVDGKTVEAVDPYARTTGVNGKRGMVIDLDATDPEGWDEDTNPNPSTAYTDAIIYELHVRDFSIDPSSGVSKDNRGKYLAFTETGLTVDADEDGTGDGNVASGIDYLKSMGFTHLHLLPVYDYGSVDETKCENFNWGYDPVNYNTPEGSYSTDPYNGEVRVEEFKQMVMSLHDAGISVIMDVVYNHVYDAGKFCMNQIVPKYFSRVNADGSYSNGSGCGNDTASEREMVRKYIVESIMYWKEEYHIDGFRFDLVGLLDETTINEIVNTVHAKYPDVIFYGEGWTLGTAVEPGNDMATQANASGTPDFAYFSDTIRNLLAGSNGSSLGFVSGLTGQEEAIRDNFMAMPWWTSDPSQIVQYASCHDNYTLVDKLVISTGKSGIDEEIIKMNNLAAAIYMTSQGIPFIHAGEEFLREKIDPSSHTGRCENSYNASDEVNHIEWSNLADEDYLANSEYYKGLIEFRKAHSALRMDSNAEIKANISYKWVTNEVVMFTIDADAAGDVSDSIVVIFNASKSSTTVGLPAGTWAICIDHDKAGTESQGQAIGSVEVGGISAMVLAQGELEHTAAEAVIENKTDATCTIDGSYDSVIKCATCGDELSRETIVIPAGHSYEGGICGNEGCENPYQADLHSTVMDPTKSLALGFRFLAEKVPSVDHVVLTHVYADGTTEEVEIARADWIEEEGIYTVYYSNIAAKEMRDSIILNFYAADGRHLNAEGGFSVNVADHAISVLEGDASAVMKTLYVDMLNYGAAAQEYFGYNTGNLANVDLTEEQLSWATTTAETNNQQEKGVGYSATSLALESKVELNFLFHKTVVTRDMYAVVTYMDHNGELVERRIEGKDFRDHTKNRFCISVDDIDAADSDSQITCQVYKDGVPVASGKDSVIGYLTRAINANMPSIFMITLRYCRSAEAVAAVE